MSTIEIRPEAILGTHEIVWVAGCGSVAHLCHFFDVVHALWNDMGGNLDVEDEVAVLEFNVPDGPALHEFFPGNGVAGAHSGREHRGSEVLGRGVIRLVREGRGDHLILVVGVEVSLRVSGMKGPIGFRLPVVFVVVVVWVIGGGRWGVIWNDRQGWLVVERIALLVVSHDFKGGTGSGQQREMVVDGRGTATSGITFFL